MALMTWAVKRQIFYVTILVLFIAVSGIIIIYPVVNKAPSCTDGKQNGTETGIDCGGSCVLACTSQADTASVIWARAFRVLPGRYNAVAYISNHNKSSAARKVNYKFRFADANNVYIGKREGSTFIPPGGNFAVFEPGIDVGNSIPVFTTFEFTEAPVWLQVPEDKINQLKKVVISDITLKEETTSPHLTATIKNNSLFTIPNVNVVAILYDGGGNAISTSRTFLDQLSPMESREIDFTWPEVFSGDVVTKELIPLYDIFTAAIK